MYVLVLWFRKGDILPHFSVLGWDPFLRRVCVFDFDIIVAHDKTWNPLRRAVGVTDGILKRERILMLEQHEYSCLSGDSDKTSRKRNHVYEVCRRLSR